MLLILFPSLHPPSNISPPHSYLIKLSSHLTQLHLHHILAGHPLSKPTFNPSNLKFSFILNCLSLGQIKLGLPIFLSPKSILTDVLPMLACSLNTSLPGNMMVEQEESLLMVELSGTGLPCWPFSFLEKNLL